MRLPALLLLLIISVFCDGEDDLVQNLPGLLFSVNFKTYSGYVDANANGTWRMHYTITESKSNPDTDPLLVWFNGGPGCSSLGGLFEELGPFYINYDGETLFENPYAWNAKANVLYLESPIGVGYSYDTTNPTYSTANDDQSLQQNFQALTNFFTKAQPKYANRTFYLSGESYAGIYIPMLTDLLVRSINNGTFPNPNFKGSAIGNGFMDVKGLLNGLTLWSAYHGRVSVQDWETIKTECAKGADVDSFDFSQFMTSTNNIDYVGNNTTCGKLLDPLLTQDGNAGGFDQYNFYQECYDESVFQAPAPGKRIKNRAFQGVSTLNTKNTAELINRFSNDNQWGYFCWNENAVWKYLNSDAVKTAFNVPSDWKSSNVTWEDCRDDIYNNYKLTYNNMHQFFNSTIQNAKSDFRFLIYNGDVDTVCNYLGDAKFIYKVATDNGFNTTDRTPWFYSDNQQLAGYVQTYTKVNSFNAVIRIDLLTVKGAGHMVPFDRAGPSVQMITNFVWADSSVNYTYAGNFNTNIQLSPLLTSSMSAVFSTLSMFIVLLFTAQ